MKKLMVIALALIMMLSCIALGSFITPMNSGASPAPTTPLTTAPPTAATKRPC